jgi:hypothetical protein
MAEKESAWRTAYQTYLGSVNDAWAEFHVANVGTGISNISIPYPWPPLGPTPCLACHAPARAA